jgi:hypothetical protein
MNHLSDTGREIYKEIRKVNLPKNNFLLSALLIDAGFRFDLSAFQ